MGLRWGFAFIALALGAGVPFGWGQDVNARQFEGEPVTSVRFDPPDQPFSTEELAGLISLKEGSAFRVSALRASIKNLFGTGRYRDVRAMGTREGRGVALVFRTEDEWFVGRVDAEGLSENPARGQTAEAARLQLGRPLFDEELDQATERVRSLLRRNGLYEARVEASVSRDPEYQIANVRFLVERGKRAKFERPVITGSPGIEPDDIISATKWHGWFGWRSVTEERTQQGLTRIQKKFADKERLLAEVVIEGLDYDPATRRLKPRLRVVSGPKVEIRTEGAELSEGKLKRYVPAYVEGAVDRDLLVEGARNLRDYFQTQGYFDVMVDFREEKAGPDEMRVTYDIDLGRRRKLERIDIQGNKFFDTETIRERMMLQPAGFLRLRHGRYSESAVKRDEDAIKALYQSNGFRDVEVATRTIDNYNGKPDEIAAVVTIEEGPQYRVSRLDTSRLGQVNRPEVRKMLSCSEGQPFSEVNIALDRDFILRQYQEAGYPGADFDWEMRPGTEPNTVEVSYRASPGEKRQVRNVLIAGTDITSLRLIQPAMRLSPGAPLSPSDMFAAQRDLYELGIFEKVDVAVQNPEGSQDRKNVIYQFSEGDRYHLAGGLGAEVARIGGNDNSYDSPAGATGFSPRANFEVSRMNLWGLGHSLTFATRVSTLQKRGLLTYTAPRYRNVEGRNITITGLFDDSKDVRTFSAKRWELSGQLSQMWSKATTMLYRYSFRRSSIDESTLKISPLLVPLASQPVRIGMLSTSFINDRRDDPAMTNKGIYTTVDAGLASKWLVSRRNFVRLLARNSTYHPLGRGDWVLARNLQFGWLGPFRNGNLDAVQAIPLPEKFFGGGSSSHRGFPDNQAGPRDPETGFPIGGNTLLFHQTELRFPFIGDNISGVLFHDMGNVYSRPGRISFRVSQRDSRDFDYMVHAAGFGVRYRTPIGPIRLDLAYSINPPRFFGYKGTTREVIEGTAPRQMTRVSRFQFFFSIGQTF
ncbi:MAG TPA: POTRA domain-containing protein [Bryobacteraceae bacterium]|nr:POTRA domain-containing protein [Bryobacteraceae bacterium]